MVNWLKYLYEQIKAESQEINMPEAKAVSKTNPILQWIVSYRMLIITSAIALMLVAGIATVILIAAYSRVTTQASQLQVFFLNSSEGILEPESHPWPDDDLEFWIDPGTWYDDTKIVWVGTTIGLLSQPPESNQLTSVWPTFDNNPPFFLYFHITDRTLVATFYDSYLKMSPLEEALFRSAFTLTMISLPFIDDAIIRVGNIEFAESSASIANAPSISSAWLSNTQLVLYFLDDTNDPPALAREYYNAVGVDILRRPRVALERLIAGSENLTTLIPPETRINAVLPAPEIFSIYVNLSGEFMTRFSGSPTQARFMIQSIVNTVIENSSPPGSLPTARQVFFLIDSARHDTFHGVPYFDRGFEYDETMIVDYEPATP